MFTALLVIYLIVSIGIIGLVLIQQGKGANMGTSFGAGASNTVFGASGSGNFLTRMTTILAIIFFMISLALGNISTQSTDSEWLNPIQEDVISEDVNEIEEMVKEKSLEDLIPQ